MANEEYGKMEVKYMRLKRLICRISQAGNEVTNQFFRDSSATDENHDLYKTLDNLLLEVKDLEDTNAL